MKRICFLTDSIFSIGGVQRVTAVIAKELAKDHSITILTFDKPGTIETSFYELQEANINYRFFSYPAKKQWKRNICKAYSALYLKLQPQTKWTSDLYAKSSFPSELRNALVTELIQGNYDVIIGVHAPLAARLATLRPMLPNVKLIGWIHNSFEALFGENSRYIGMERERHYVYQFKKLDKAIVLCQHDANTYQHYDPAFHPSVIYNPLTIQPGKPSDGTSKRFLAVGRFAKQHKGFDLLIKAFHLFAQKNKEWILDLVGEGVEEPLYRSLIKQYQLEDRVIIHPFTNKIQDFYSNAQIYVLSSRWEGFGLVLVEAMAHGLPVISSDLPTSKEIMGDFGLYFKNGDTQDLAHRLNDATIIDWKEKSRKAFTVAKKFDLEHIIEEWKRLIEN